MLKQTKVTYIVTAFIVVFTVVVALYLLESRKKSPTSESPAIMESGKRYFSARYPVIDDCSKDIPLNLIDDNSIDLENGVIEVYWFDAEKQENTKRTFLYRPGANSEKCSETVKSKLEQTYQTEQRRLEEYRKSCVEWKAILSGKKPLPEKGGEKASMQGIVESIEKYCQ